MRVHVTEVIALLQLKQLQPVPLESQNLRIMSGPSDPPERINKVSIEKYVLVNTL